MNHGQPVVGQAPILFLVVLRDHDVVAGRHAAEIELAVLVGGREERVALVGRLRPQHRIGDRRALRVDDAACEARVADDEQHLGTLAGGDGHLLLLGRTAVDVGGHRELARLEARRDEAAIGIGVGARRAADGGSGDRLAGAVDDAADELGAERDVHDEAGQRMHAVVSDHLLGCREVELGARCDAVLAGRDRGDRERAVLVGGDRVVPRVVDRVDRHVGLGHTLSAFVDDDAAHRRAARELHGHLFLGGRLLGIEVRVAAPRAKAVRGDRESLAGGIETARADRAIGIREQLASRDLDLRLRDRSTIGFPHDMEDERRTATHGDLDRIARVADVRALLAVPLAALGAQDDVACHDVVEREGSIGFGGGRARAEPHRRAADRRLLLVDHDALDANALGIRAVGRRGARVVIGGQHRLWSGRGPRVRARCDRVTR